VKEGTFILKFIRTFIPSLLSKSEQELIVVSKTKKHLKHLNLAHVMDQIM